MTETSPTPAPASGGVSVKDGNEVTKFVPSPPASVENATGLMKTARRSHGGTLSREPSGGDIVTVKGIELSLDQAVKHGFIQRSADGRYSDLGQEAQDAAVENATKQPEPQPFDDTHALAFTDEQSDALTGVTGMLEAVGQNPVALIGEVFKHGNALPPTLAAAARQQGIPEADAQAQYLQAAHGVKEAIGEYVIEAGVSPEQLDGFWNYADRNVPPAKLASMVAQAAFIGDARPFADLAWRFRASHGSGIGSATQTEQTRVQSHGGRRQHIETVRVKGVGRVSLEGARRLKIV